MGKQKRKRRAEYPETEIFTKRCLEQHPNEVEEFTHHSLRGRENARGRDFTIRLKSRKEAMHFQIKTSSNTDTIGLVLPLVEYDKIPEVSGRMGHIIIEHVRKHPKELNILFVGKPVHGKSQGEILKDIWREILKIFKENERRRNI